MNKLQLLKLSLATALFAPFCVFADEGGTPEADPVLEPPEWSDSVESGEVLEPEVTIIRRDDATITEYRINGNLYMVKIQPAVGKPYYLIDRDGDGQMEGRTNDIYEDILVPQWVLFRW